MFTDDRNFSETRGHLGLVSSRTPSMVPDDNAVSHEQLLDERRIKIVKTTRDVLLSVLATDAHQEAADF